MATRGSLSFRWNWEAPGQQNACSSLPLSWVWASDNATLAVELSLTQVEVPQPAPPSSSVVGQPTPSAVFPSASFTNPVVTTNPFATGDPFVTARAYVDKRQGSDNASFQMPIVSPVLAAQEQFTWTQLTAPQGWYQLIAFSLPDGAVDKRSASFFVWNATDMSCLPTVVPTVSSSQAAPTASTTSPGDGAEPVQGSSKPNTGAIAGGVVGGVVVLAIVAFLLFWFRRRRAPSKSVRGSIGAKENGLDGTAVVSGHRKAKYGGLSSVDSIDAVAALRSAGEGGAVAMADRKRRQDTDEDEKVSPTSPYENGYTFTPDALGYQPSVDSRRPSAVARYSASSQLSGGVPMNPHGAISTSPPPHVDRFASSPSPPLTDGSATLTPGKPRRKPVPSYTPSTISGISSAPNIGVIPALPPLHISHSTSSESHGQSQSWAGSDGKVHYLMPDMPPPSRS